MHTPLYLDWAFWTAVVAALALVLSQLPPIHTLLRRARLEIELYSRVLVTHKVGNPNVQLHLILTNSGGRSIRIKGITLSLTRDGKNIVSLPAQNYLQNPGDKTNVLLTSFALKSKEEWAHIVNFFNIFSRSDEKRYKSAQALLKSDIIEKRKLPENKDIVVEADGAHVSPFLEMFGEKFVWLPGEYEFQVSVDASDEKAGISRTYRFTLFESDSAELSGAKDDYKLGDGIYWDSGNHLGVTVQIVEA